MDQMIVDITGISGVKAGETAVMAILAFTDMTGKSATLPLYRSMTAYELAEKTEAITNEIMSRLGERLERIWGN